MPLWMLGCSAASSGPIGRQTDQPAHDTATDSTDGTGRDGGSGTDASGCAPLDGVPGESVVLTLDHDGETRTALLRFPAGFDCTPRPLLVGFHGYYGSGQGFAARTSAFLDTVDERGFVGVFPDGLALSSTGPGRNTTSFNDGTTHASVGPDGPTCTEDAYDYGVYENCPPSEAEDACNWGTSCADDAGFVRALIERALADWFIDPDRVFLTGFSQGGQTAQGLADDLSDVVAATAPHHGFAANGYTAPPTTPMGLFQVWAPRDTTVDGTDQPSSDGMIYDGAEETLAAWATAQGCSETASPYPTPWDGVREWACTTHAGCATGAEVVSCSWGGRHTWGRTDAREFARDATLAFFGIE